MNLIDVNILVTAHREDAEQHTEIKSWLLNALESEEGCAKADRQKAI